VGERTREGRWQEELAAQARATFSGIPAASPSARCLIAYEPVWAISTNPGAHPDTPENASESVTVIRSALNSTLDPMPLTLRFLYGGSVTPANAAGFLAHFDGVLVGGASVRKEDFIGILEAAR
jgi:triosephosphate isomerase